MPFPIPIPRIRRLAPVAASLLLAVAVAACAAAPGGEGVVSLEDPSASPGASAAPSASVDPEEAMQAFVTCMREHGVDIQVAVVGEPGSAVGGGIRTEERPQGAAPAQPGTGPDPEEAQAAEEACRHLLPAGGMGDPNATMDPELADQLLEFAACMRDQGIDFPDPQFEGGGVTQRIGGPNGEGGIDPSSEEFQAAQEACGDMLPGGRAPFVSGGETAP